MHLEVEIEGKSELKNLSYVTIVDGGQLWPLISDAVLLKITAISTQMHLNGEILYPYLEGVKSESKSEICAHT